MFEYIKIVLQLIIIKTEFSIIMLNPNSSVNKTANLKIAWYLMSNRFVKFIVYIINIHNDTFNACSIPEE